MDSKNVLDRSVGVYVSLIGVVVAAGGYLAALSYYDIYPMMWSADVCPQKDLVCTGHKFSSDPRSYLLFAATVVVVMLWFAGTRYVFFDE